MYGNGRGVPENDAEAVKWWRKAAMQDVPAHKLHSVCHIWKAVVCQENDVMGYAWIIAAAAKGDKNAQKIKSLIRNKMTPSQIEKAQAIALRFFNRIKKQPLKWPTRSQR